MKTLGKSNEKAFFITISTIRIEQSQSHTWILKSVNEVPDYEKYLQQQFREYPDIINAPIKRIKVA